MSPWPAPVARTTTSRSASGWPGRPRGVEQRPVGLGGVPLAQRLVVGLGVGEQLAALVVGEQGGCDRDRPRGVLDPDHRALVARRHLDGRVRARGGGAADQQRDLEPLALHLAGEVDHLVERRRDQPGQADQVGADLGGLVEDLLRRHHHAEVDHLVVVALQHHADDVLADVVDVALHRGHHDGAVGVLGGGVLRVVELLLLDERDQVGDRLLHHPRGLHHLGQEHLAGAEQVADDVHAVHQRTLDHLDRTTAARLDLGAELLGVLLDVGVDALDQRVGDPLPDRQRAPLEGSHLLLLAGAAVLLGDLEQSLGGVGAAVEHDVLDPLAQLGLDLVVHHQRAGVDDAHVEPGLDRVEQEHRVDRLAHRVVAAEGERDVGDAAGDAGAGEVLLDPAGRLDEVERRSWSAPRCPWPGRSSWGRR